MEPDHDSGGPSNWHAKMAREESPRNDPLREEMLEDALENLGNASLASDQAPDNGAGAGFDSQLNSSTGQPDQTPDNEAGVGNQENSSAIEIDLTADPAQEGEDITEEWPEEKLDSMDKKESEKYVWLGISRVVFYLLKLCRFRRVEDKFNALKRPTAADQIEFERARNEELARQKRMLKRKRLNALDDDQELFVLPELGDEQGPQEDEQALQDLSNYDQSDIDLLQALAQDEPALVQEKQQPKNKMPATKRRKQIRLSAADARRGMQLGLESNTSRKRASGKGRKRKTNTMDPEATAELDADGAAGQQRASKRGRKTRRVPDEEPYDWNSLFTANVVEAAHESAKLESIPIISGRLGSNKEIALTQLVASIPVADQGAGNSDKKRLLDASRKFTPSARNDGQGGWKIKGMKTSLYHCQVCTPFRSRDLDFSANRKGIATRSRLYGKYLLGKF